MGSVQPLPHGARGQGALGWSRWGLWGCRGCGGCRGCTAPSHGDRAEGGCEHTALLGSERVRNCQICEHFWVRCCWGGCSGRGGSLGQGRPGGMGETPSTSSRASRGHELVRKAGSVGRLQLGEETAATAPQRPETWGELISGGGGRGDRLPNLQKGSSKFGNFLRITEHRNRAEAVGSPSLQVFKGRLNISQEPGQPAACLGLRGWMSTSSRSPLRHCCCAPPPPPSAFYQM